MTEEIIVNGFDVSECYADNKMMKDGLYCFWEGGKCEDNEYCYYKECKRLEQENKELGRKAFLAEQNVQTTAATFCEKDNKIKELEQENKELKEKKDKYYQQTLDDEILMNELSLEVDLRKKESNFYLEKLSKYRSALEEIIQMFLNQVAWVGQLTNFEEEIYNKINEVLQ